MVDVREVSFELPDTALPEADWADCYQVVVARRFESPKAAGEAIVAAFPKWTYSALALRQILVTPFGLAGPKDVPSDTGRIGIFPVISEGENRIVAGLDDKHLDFRIIVETKNNEAGQEVRLATIIKRHNALGRMYLQAVMPFHRAIIGSALKTMAKSRAK